MKLYVLGKYILSALTVIILLGGCTRRDLLVHPDDGYLRIRLDWRSYKEPQATGYYFYNSRGDAPIYREGTSRGFEGYLPAETYKVVIFNTDMVGADMINKQNYDEDQVVARELSSRGIPDYINHVENVYAIGITEVTVPKGKVADERVAKPVNFVKRLTCIIHPGDVEDINDIDVELCGAVPGRYNVANLPTTDQTSTLKSNARYKSESDTYETYITSLGYMGTCDLVIFVNYENGGMEEALPISLTEELNNFPEDDKVVEFTFYLPSGKEMQLQVAIEGWKESGGIEIPID